MRNKKGLTLVEVVVAVGLFGIIMVALFPAFLITNLMNNISKEFTEASFYAQSEIEEIYNRSQVVGTDPSVVLSDMGYSCIGQTCMDSLRNTKFNFVIKYETDSTTQITSIILTVVSKVGDSEYQGNRAEIESHMRFGE